jgi:hypothetical protein
VTKSGKRTMAGSAVAEFESLAEGLRDSSLKTAVERLVARRRKR